MIRRASLACIVLLAALVSKGQTMPELHTFFRERMGLSDDQITVIARGRAVAKVLPSKMPAEIFIFGAVFVNATPEEYLRLALDIGRLKRFPSYLGAGRFSDPPMLSDLQGFTLEPEDIKNLKTCRPGKCDVQLSAEAMQELRSVPDSSGPQAATLVNDKIQRMALRVLQRYEEDGNRVLGSYLDKDRPFHVETQLRSLLDRLESLLIYLPELDRYLMEYPNTVPANVESLFYWEKVNFGLKPTLRVNHAIAYRSEDPRGVADIVAVKELYASHYFRLALDLTSCVTESGRSSDKGFYLINLKGSILEGFTGLKGPLLRKIVLGKTRAAQEKALLNIKKALEANE
jgi:hypothetical protein